MADTEVIGDTTAEKMSTEDITTEPEDTPKTEDITENNDSPKEDITETETETETEPSKTVKEELVKVETEELAPDSIVQDTVDENGEVFEETTEVTRKVVKRTMKITETSSTTKTTTMTTPAKLYGKDLSEYDEVDVDALLAQLSPEEINILAKEVDPDDNFLPPNQRCSYECTKDPTGPLNRKKLIEHINKEALETPDLPEQEPYVKGTVRGKKWIPPPRDEREIAADEQIAIDMGEEYEHALSDATQEEIIDLAAILGFHSMMNQDQYHASLLNKGQPVGLGWDGITKSTQQKLYPMDPPNNTDVEDSIKRVKDDDTKLIELNLNNIKNISDEKFQQLFDALPQNEHLEVLSLTNVGLTDKTALLLAEAIEKSKTLRVLNVETNFINPPVVVTLVKALLKARTIEEFRASNQRSTVLGNKIEMEITDLVEKNTSLLRLGLHLEFNDARHRVAAHLQRNIDRNEHEFRKGISSSPIPNATSTTAAGTVDGLSSFLSSQKTAKAKSPKPLQSVLTSQEKIDSKSELIASLVSQKLSDRGKDEISLAVPQIVKASKETKFPVSASSSLKENRSSIKAEEVSLRLVEANRTEVRRIAEKQTSPTRHPKIGELRYSSISRAVDKESNSLQESGGRVSSELAADKLTQPAKEDNNPIVETINAEKEAPNLKAPDKSNDVSQPLIESSSALSKPKKSDDRPISVNISQTRIEVSTEKSVIETSYSYEVTENVKNSKMLGQPETSQKAVTATDRSSNDLTKDRERLSESVSPSRHLENNLTLLQAKIDSFAEVADEKLSSLRSKFDDIARDTSTDQPMENVKPSGLLRPKEPIKTVDVPTDPDKPLVDKILQPADPSTLPPKAPPKNLNVSKGRALVRTPNSIGISFLYQKQLLSKAMVSVGTAIAEKVSSDVLLEQKKCEEKIVKSEKISASDARPKISPQMVEFSNPKTSNLSSEEIKLKDKELIPNPASPSTDSPKAVDDLKPKTSTIQTAERITDSSKPIDDRKVEIPAIKLASPITDSDKPIIEPKPEIPTVEPINTTTDSSKLIEKPDSDSALNTKKPKLDDKATILSLLTIKKRDALQIEPIKKIEAATQSAAQPSPLARLSIKKGDAQTIDAIKKTEVGTQSLAKPNPLSMLSVKRNDRIDINPVARSEVSIQASRDEPKIESSSQTVDEDLTITFEEATQTPLLFSSLEHNYVFPGLRNVPHLPRPKTINIGAGDRVVIKPSSKTINEVLMLLYPVVHDYRTTGPDESSSSSKASTKISNFITDAGPESTIKDLEEAIQKATKISDSIVRAEESIKPVEETIPSIKTEIEIPLVEASKPDPVEKLPDDSANISTAVRHATKFTSVEKVSALSHTTIASEAHLKVIDKAYKSVAEVSSSEEEQVSKTSIRSANMWQSLSSNLIKASEQTLMDIAKSADLSETVSSTRTKIGKVSVYSSIENLSDASRSKYSDRHVGGLIKTVEKTSVYSSTEDLPLTSYTKYSDRYSDDYQIKTTSKASVNSSTEDLLQSSRTKYSDRYASDIVKSMGKASVYSSTEDLYETSYTKYSDRYSDDKTLGKTSFKSKEDSSFLPRSKFCDRYKDDHIKTLDTHRSHSKFPISQELSHISTTLDRSYYKSAVLDNHLKSQIQYKSTEDLSHRSKIGDRGTHELFKSHDKALQTAVLSSISRNQSALRPYTYVPTSAVHTDLAIDHVRTRPSSPSAVHTSTLQLNVSPSGISELTPTRISRYSYIDRDTIDKPKIVISRPKDESRSFRAISPIERSRPMSNLLTPHRRVSDQPNDDLIDNESSQSTLDISSASASTTAAEHNASKIPATTTTTPKKRANIMDTIKMLKNRVRDVITTEDRFSETHRLPSSSSNVQPSSTRTSTRTTSSSLNIPHDHDEKEI